ncbi:MAG TPA: VWA domain-containing protein [Myxococcota bacterium]|nr:VWA domain-containing protein [Myxococcota bacterium]
MKVYRYQRWDGSQLEFSLDPKEALDAVSDFLMEGMSLQEALDAMRQYGFDLAGREMRVMGVQDLLRELRQQARALEQQYHLRESTDELRRRLDEILDREQGAVREADGHESARHNDFMSRRHADDGDPGPVSEAVERFRDWRFEDEAAGEAFRELLDELDRLRALERFQEQRGERFRGPEAAGYEQAQEIRERMESLEAMAQALQQGNLPEIDPETLRELLGSDAAESLVLLRDLESSLEQAGYLREGGDPQLTPKAIRRLGAGALAEVYGALHRGRAGSHEIDARGVALPRPDETRPFVFGDPLDVDVVKTVLGAAKRHARERPGEPQPFPVELSIDDFEVRERDYGTQATTVLLLDMSWSMSWEGRFAAAKRVALAMDHLIRTRFPRDHFFVVGFYTRAEEIPIPRLPEVTWNMGDPFTNLQDGLRVAQRLIARHPSHSPQILVITDGQPTAYFVGSELRVEWPMGVNGISPRAAQETLKEVRRVTGQGATINTFMLDDSPELVSFVARMTQINRGRVFYSSPAQLGSYLMVDYLAHRKQARR